MTGGAYALATLWWFTHTNGPAVAQDAEAMNITEHTLGDWVANEN